MSESLKLVVVPLDKSHDRDQFDCGEPSLNNYLKTKATQDKKRNVAQPFVMVNSSEPTRIIGYYTLSNYTIELATLPDEVTKRLPKYPNVGATLLGRIALDKQFQGQGLGSSLLSHALEKSLEVSTAVASWGVVVDALDDAAKNFYNHHGFVAFEQESLKLYLSMQTIKQSLTQ